MKKLISLIVLCGMISSLVIGAGAASAATSCIDSWDVPGDLSGWGPNTVWTNVTVADTGGNPDGYLYTESTMDLQMPGTPYRGYAGAKTEKEECIGDFTYAQTVSVSFDLKVFVNEPDDNVYLRFRYHDASYNGWHYILTDEPVMNEWVTYTVTFNPNWTDSEASSAGWIQELTSPSFSDTMADVYYTEIRMEHTFAGGALGYVSAGIDNFELIINTVYQVDIDIKPGSNTNSINLKSNGVIPVAILTTDAFDAATVDPATVVFAGATPVRWAVEDVDGDGDLDVIFFFKTQEVGIMAGDTEATLTGNLMDSTPFTGTDTVRTVPQST